MCGRCAEALKARGYTTYSGYQVQENYHVPLCYPGIVHVRAEQFLATEAKLADVELEKVKISDQLCRETGSGRKRSKCWRKMVIEDLDKLHRLTNEAQPFTFALAGIGISGARPMVSARTPYTAAKALACRVYRRTPVRPWGRGPVPGIWDWCDRFVDYLLPDFRRPAMTVEEWLESMPTRRRKPLSNAWEEYKHSGWSDRYAKFSSFVKTEFLPGFGKTKFELVRLARMVDRLIQGPADGAHVIAGPKLKPLVGRLKECWSSTSPIFYGSTGPEPLHKFMKECLVDSEHQYFWCDFSMFETTHSHDSWDFMERIYRRAGISDPDFWRVMKAWRKPSGKAGPAKYTARVMNASGRDDTALANGILNGIATYLSACAAWLNKPLRTLTLDDVKACRKSISLSVCGDDSIGALPLCDDTRMEAFSGAMKANVAAFGFETKLEHSRYIGDAVYLGMRPYPVGGDWFWGKTIGRAMYKMGWVMLNDGRDVMSHVTGIAEMHVKCSLHVPVLADLAQKIVELRQGAKRLLPKLDQNRPWEWPLSGGLSYDAQTLAHTARVYGVEPCELSDAIASIKAITRLPCVVDHPVLKRMILIDDL